MPLATHLVETATASGADSAVRAYRALRTRYYGRDAYDFGEPTLNTAAFRLARAGKYDEALAFYKILMKRNPSDRLAKAGIELAEGMRAMASRDRLEAAQRFEAVLELDPANERAARELAEMRRLATNERKGMLSRLLGKKE